MEIASRASWGARSARNRTRQSNSIIREFFIHWPGAIPESWENVNTIAEERATMRSIQAFHMGPERNWADFAYNWGMFASGRVYRGRGLAWVPAAQLGHNTGTVACVVFLGPDDRVPKVVEENLARLKRHIERRVGHPVDARPHRAVTGTECPGPRLTVVANNL